MGTKSKCIFCALCLMAFALTGAAQDNNWKLLETTTFGAGGFWENGQTVRIDRSFRAGTFSYERKVTAGQSLSVFSSKGTFSTLKEKYTPGETLTVTVSISASGNQSAAPDHVYGRVTLLQGDPGWTRENWASQKIAAAGSVAGQLTGSGGSFLVTPDGIDALTLSGTIPTSGNRMAIVFSCNGMDVLHLYGREGAAQETSAGAALAKKVEDKPATTAAAEATEKEQVAENEQTVGQETQPSVKENALKFEFAPLEPRIKLLVLGVLLLAAIIDLIWMFSKPRK